MQVWISESPDQMLADFSASLIRTESFVMGKFNGKNFSPIKSKSWDLHRRVRDLFFDEIEPPILRPQFLRGETKGFQEGAPGEEIKKFYNKYGDLFSPMGSSCELSVWMLEMREISKAVDVIDRKVGMTDQEFKVLINEKIGNYAMPEFITKKSDTQMVHLAIRPLSLAGFIWALIARDHFDGIPYSPCPGFELCGREVPSRTPTGKKPKFCSSACQKRIARHRRENREPWRDKEERQRYEEQLKIAVLAGRLAREELKYGQPDETSLTPQEAFNRALWGAGR